jgi:hypothetical protein
MMSMEEKNRRTALILTFVLVGVIVYSLVVIKTRGRLPEPAHLTRLQRILRGL